jgi:D-serine dehydratase
VYDEQQLHAIRDLLVDPTEKGFGGPLHRIPLTVAALIDAAPHVGDGWLSAPRAQLSDSALRHNIDVMARYCAERSITLYPHGKTTMSPQIVAAQLTAGAAGVTVASVAQARLFRRFGVRRILIANQLVDEASIAWIARELSEDPDLTLHCYVDSFAGVGLLERHLASHGAARRLPVLVELGHAGGRSGARTRGDAFDVAVAVARSSRLTLAGVAGYEGSIAAATVDETVVAARAFCDELGVLAAKLLDAQLFDDVPMVTAGGSAYFDAVVAALGDNPEWGLVLRSGCYVAHDHGIYRSISPFERSSALPDLVPALTVWAPVLSRPERHTVIVGAGRRDVSSDAGLPSVVNARGSDGSVDVAGLVAERIFDQHLVVTASEHCELSVGDEVCLGPSHPCTTFDKWRWLPVVNDDQKIVDVVRTFF